MVDNIEKPRKNFFWRMKEIFEYLSKQKDFIYKSELKNVGLDANSAEVYIQVIELIQQELVEKNQQIVVNRAGRYTVIKLEKR